MKIALSVFSLLKPSPQKTSILTSFLPYQNSPSIRSCSDTPIHFTVIEQMMSLDSISGMLPITFRIHLIEKGSETFQTRFLVSQKVIKWTEEGAILIIIVEGCFILMYLSFILTIL